MIQAAFLFQFPPLATPGQQPQMLLVACFSLFAVLLALHAFRVQPLPAFAGLALQQLLTFFYHAALLAALLWSWPIAALALNTDWSSGAFFFLLSIHWLSLALFSPRALPAPRAGSFFGRWLLFALISFAVLCGAGLLENYVRGSFTFAPNFYHLLRQISAGFSAGILLVTALILAYRNLRSRQAVWFWLFSGALLAALAIIVRYQLPAAHLLQIGALSLSSIFIILGLLADRARFLNFESELRRNLMDTAAQWETQARQLIAVLAHGSEAIVHLDLDERITFANPAFVQLSAARAEDLSGQSLQSVLPRHFYDALIPALQEARRERAARMDLHFRIGEEEKVMQVAHAPLFNERQKVQGVHLGLMDVKRYYSAERMRSGEIAEKSRDLRMFQRGVENATEAIAITNAQYQVLYANDAFVRTTSLARHEIVERDLKEYRKEQFYPWDEIKRRLAQNKPWRGEVSYSGTDGRTHASDLSVLPIEDAEESFVRYLWIERDITQAIAERTQELERRVQQLSKLVEISEAIRLNTGLEEIMHSVAEAIHALGWQRVAIFCSRGNEQFELVSSAGFGENESALPRKFRKLAYADFAPYLLETFRLSSSFFIDSRKLSEKRPYFMPRELQVFEVGEWREHDCLLVPIRSRDRYDGMIAVFSPHNGRHPQQQQARELEIFADDAAAIAIANSRSMSTHASNEHQVRTLNRIGNTFRAAGTLQQVLCEIAGILAEAMAQPVVIAMRTTPAVQNRLPSNGNPGAGPIWLAAAAHFSRKSKSESAGRLLTISVGSGILLAQLCKTAVENEIRTSELAGEDLHELLKSPRARSGNARCRAQLAALHSRQENFGCIFWLPGESQGEWEEERLGFARDLATQAALTIDNARLILQTEEKAHALEHANQHIADFLASVSHELRTPLHAILQFSEIMLSEKPGGLNHEQKHQIEIVQRSGKNLLKLINDILDLGKIEAGKMEASWQAFNALEMIRETVAAIRPLALDKGLNVQLRLPSALPENIVSDRYMLARVLTNLLGNAVKFTDSGEVTVTAEYQNRVLTIGVRDTGKGIPAHRLQEIFEPFRQLESGEARKYGGTGLGLAISQKLMGILGGQIEVQSEKGKGSVFKIKLPVRELSKAEQKARRQKGEAPLEKAENRPSRQGIFSKWLSSGKKKNFSILVVEDDENTRYAMEFILEDAGYQVKFAENGEKALLAAQHDRPDMILMDIMMPNLDGYQVARLLKAQKQLQHIPLVALTARAMKGDREKALAAGYDDYLTKPFEKKDILAVIARWLEERVESKAS